MHPLKQNAEIAQLVEHNLAKVRVASSSLVFRSSLKGCSNGGIGRHEGLKIPWPLRLCGFKSRFEYKYSLLIPCKRVVYEGFLFYYGHIAGKSKNESPFHTRVMTPKKSSCLFSSPFFIASEKSEFWRISFIRA